MFYKWFEWQWEITDIDVREPIDKWKITPVTRFLFIEMFVRIITE